MLQQRCSTNLEVEQPIPGGKQLQPSDVKCERHLLELPSYS